jgi:hypothetical protein
LVCRDVFHRRRAARGTRQAGGQRPSRPCLPSRRASTSAIGVAFYNRHAQARTDELATPAGRSQTFRADASCGWGFCRKGRGTTG